MILSRSWKALVVVIAALLLGCGKAGAGATPIRIACVGDSITAGAGASSPSQSYPAQLARMLGEGWEVGYFGKSGKAVLQNSNGPYAQTATLTHALAFQPDVVVIQLGTNDTKELNWKFKDQFAADYKSLIAQFQALPTKPRIFLCRPPFIAGPNKYGIIEANLLEAIPMIDAIAQETSLPEIDNYAATQGKNDLFPDNVHPNDEGAGVLARTVYQAVTGKPFSGETPTAPLAAASPPDAPADSPVFTLWPEGKMPGAGADKPEETKPHGKDGVLLLTNVSQPTLTLVKATGPATAPTPAMIVCPGGAYSVLAFHKEGTEIAAWLNSIGITAVVLKYRVPDNRDGALQDLARAVRVVRTRAGEWNIDPKRIGVIGFSAGGHLCARLSCNFDQPAYTPVDTTDEQIPRPDFTVLVYPAYLEKDGQIAPELAISNKIPPTLLVHTEDDRHYIAGSKLYHAALDQAGVPNQFVLFPTGGHGYGLRCTGDAAAWPDRCRDWLKQTEILKTEEHTN